MFTILTTKEEINNDIPSIYNSILDKISQKDMVSLSDEEKDFLDKKSKDL